jgi:Fe2+ or Zn2+ uptake regulation protein
MKNEKQFQFSRTPRTPRAAFMLRSLAEAGYSDTRARRAVVGALCDEQRGTTPAALLARGKSRHARLGQVTVYRTLDILQSLGLVRRLHQEDGSATYAAATRAHGHHVICSRCHRAVEFEGCSLGGVLRDVSARTGFTVERHWLELFGTCPSCRRKQ